MSAFDLFPTALAHERGQAVDPNAGGGFFEGSLTAPLTGLAKGLTVEPTRVLNMALSNIPGAVDRALGTSTRDWWFENMMLKDVNRRVTPNPRETGMAGQMLHALFDVGSQAVAAGPAGVLTAKAVGGTIEGVEAGLDIRTAEKKALLEAGAAAAGVALPIYLPPVIGSRIPALVQQLGYGVAANVPLGIVQRGLTHKVLADAGYKDMAEQYKALDETGLLTDLVLGVAFGGLGHVLQTKGVKLGAINPSDVDAALTKRNAYHLEVDTAPGLPKTAEARDAHVDAHLEATTALIEGRPVDIAKTLGDVEFIPNPEVDAGRARLLETQREIGSAYDQVRENPLGAPNDPLVRMTAKDIGEVLLERGPTLPSRGEIEVRAGNYGLVKILWKHGEKSKKDPSVQVTRDDVVNTPAVLNEYVPIVDRISGSRGRTLAWQVERADGKRVVYGVRGFSEADGKQHVVTVFVNDGTRKEWKDRPLSQPKAPESPGAGSRPAAGDTASGAFSVAASKGQVAPSVDQIGQALKAEGVEVTAENVALVDQIARARALDAAAVDALPDTMPDGEYMARIKEIINAKQANAEAGADRARAGNEGAGAARGEAGARQAGAEAAGRPAGEAQPGGESARAVEAAEIKGAEEVAAARPDMPVTLEDGTVTTAREALARADEVIAQADQDSKAFEAAVLCATRRGG